MPLIHSPTLPPPHDIAGVPVHPVRLEGLLAWIGQVIARRQRANVMYANAYAVNLAHQHPPFREALNGADAVFCDGYGVWLAARLLGQPLPQRFTPPDWITYLAARCAQAEHRLFLLGAEPGVAERAAGRLRTAFPSLCITTRHGYFDPGGPENEEVLRQINGAAPDILLVGMGMPRQELWMQANLERHSAPVVIAVGALFDYLAGQRQRGPSWLTDSGGEWLWRLAAEPRRLWRRYLLGNPAFAWLLLREWWCARQLQPSHDVGSHPIGENHPVERDASPGSEQPLSES